MESPFFRFDFVWITVLILVFILVDFIIDLVVDALEMQRMRRGLSPAAKSFYKEEDFEKYKRYKRINNRFSLLVSSLQLAGAIVIILTGFFGTVDEWVRSITDHSMLQALLFLGVLGLSADILSTPFSLYRTFVIEEKFGFNKTTPKTFVLDKIKGYLLGGLIGGGLLCLIIWIWEASGPYFWLLGWMSVSGFSLFMFMFYTRWLLPLFNKLSPLKDEGLKEKIKALAEKVKFPFRDIVEMDGSKRSTKANAFFSGIGPTRKIVLFDTLIKDYSHSEVVSVLAHEVGHYKKKHTLYGLIVSVFTMGITFWVVSLVLEIPEISYAIGFSTHSFYSGMIAFGLLFAPVNLFTGMIMNSWSRKNEFEADAYAAQHSDGEALVSALVKLHVDALSNPDPHPLNVTLNYSHPPLLKRIEAIRRSECR